MIPDSARCSQDTIGKPTSTISLPWQTKLIHIHSINDEPTLCRHETKKEDLKQCLHSIKNTTTSNPISESVEQTSWAHKSGKCGDEIRRFGMCSTYIHHFHRWKVASFLTVDLATVERSERLPIHWRFSEIFTTDGKEPSTYKYLPVRSCKFDKFDKRRSYWIPSRSKLSWRSWKNGGVIPNIKLHGNETLTIPKTNHPS